MTALDNQNVEVLAPSLLIVIVCYRVVDLTIQCLDSIAGQIHDMPGMQVVVCDNGTGPEAVEQLRHHILQQGWDTWATLQAISPNVGFTGGNNAVLREAMQWPMPPKYFLLLNADTVVLPGALKHLYESMEASPKVGIMGASLVNPTGKMDVSCFRDLSPLSEFLRGAGTGIVNRLLFRDDFPLMPAKGSAYYDWVSFAAAVIRTEVIREIGFLDEGYFLYFDDADYCRVARKAGWKIACCEDAKVIHYEGQSNEVPESTRMLKRRPRYFYVSRSRYFAKHLGTLGLWIANMAWSIGAVLGCVKQLLLGRRPNSCESEWRDIWANAWAPVRKSNASLIPKESRFVV